MAQARTEPREMEFEKIITHLEMLEEIDPEHKDSEGNQNDIRAHSQNDNDRGNNRFKNESTSNNKTGNNSIHNGKSCNIWEFFKGKDFVCVENPQYKRLQIKELL